MIAEARLEESARGLARLTPEQLATRLPAFWMHGRARRERGQFAAALGDLERGIALAAATGRDRVLLILAVESVPVLTELGRIQEAVAAAEDGVERARLAGNPRVHLWALSALAGARLAAGDVTAALRHAEDAAALGARPDFHAPGQPGWCLGTALAAGGEAERAVAVLREAFGAGLAAVPPAERPLAAADLVEAQLAAGDLTGAEATLALGEAAAARGARRGRRP